MAFHLYGLSCGALALGHLQLPRGNEDSNEVIFSETSDAEVIAAR